MIIQCTIGSVMPGTNGRTIKFRRYEAELGDTMRAFDGTIGTLTFVHPQGRFVTLFNGRANMCYSPELVFPTDPNKELPASVSPNKNWWADRTDCRRKRCGTHCDKKSKKE